MICFLNRKQLVTESSARELARVKDVLKKNNIEYELITKKSQSTLGMMFHANMAMEVGNGAFSHSQSVGPVSFVYIINVKKKEYEMALKAIKD